MEIFVMIIIIVRPENINMNFDYPVESGAACDGTPFLAPRCFD